MTTQLSAVQWINELDLQPHPEGGFFRETYRSPDLVPATGLPQQYSTDRPLATAIYYLLRGDDISRLHRLRADEIWYFHAGNPLILHQLFLDGVYLRTRLGLDPATDARPQWVVPAGSWFGAEVGRAERVGAGQNENDEPGAFTLVSCSLAPGFEFADFELGRQEDLLAAWPEHAALIERMV